MSWIDDDDDKIQFTSLQLSHSHSLLLTLSADARMINFFNFTRFLHHNACSRKRERE